MAIVLASKPGLTSATALSIPKDWDATWYRNHINNLLKGADVRNAIGANGISVTGNIASPYATIGFKAPITLPAPVNINTPDNISAMSFNDTAPASGYYIGFANAGVLRGGIGLGSILGAGIALGDLALNAFTGTLRLGTAGAPTAISVAQAGNVTIAAPSGGATLTINGVAGQYAEVVNGSATTGQSFGLEIVAGTNASDAALRVINHAVTANLFEMFGDGSFILGSNSSGNNTVSGSAAGNVAIAAPTSGIPLTINGTDQGVSFTNGTATVQIQTSANSGYIGTTNNGPFNLLVNNSIKLTIATDGGITIGSPTGGSKGAGTINVASGIYLNGVAYTNP